MKKFNFESKTAWWIVEPGINIVIYNGNVMHQCDNGKRDSLGRTLDAFIAYRDRRFLEGILSCWKLEDGWWRGKRYPVDYPTEVPMSRDHVYNTIFALKRAVDWEMVPRRHYEHFISHQPVKLSDFAKQSISMRLWLKLLQGKPIGKLYYPLTLLTLKAYKVWNKFIYKITGTGEIGWEQHQDEFKPILIFPRATILDKITGWLFPNYALMSIGNQIEILDNNYWKTKIKKEAWDLIPKYNYVGKLLFDHPEGVTKEEVEAYKPMIGDRWSDILNPWINYGRNIYPLEKEWLGENELDRDLLITLWEEKTGQSF